MRTAGLLAGGSQWREELAGDRLRSRHQCPAGKLNRVIECRVVAVGEREGRLTHVNVAERRPRVRVERGPVGPEQPAVVPISQRGEVRPRRASCVYRTRPAGETSCIELDKPCVLNMASGSGTVRPAAGCWRRVRFRCTPAGRAARTSAAEPQASDSASWRASWLNPKTLSCRSKTPHMCLPRAEPRSTFSRILRVEDVSEPTSGTGEVKLRARAASLNPLDCKIRVPARSGYCRAQGSS